VFNTDTFSKECMKRSRSFVFAFFGLVLLCPLSVRAQSQPQAQLDLPGAFQKTIADTAVKYGLRGVTAAVIIPGQEMWQGAFGLSEPGIPMRPEMLISVASLTKTVTGALILQLVEEGLLDLDEPAANWLPVLPNVPGDATIRQLLNHTSGVFNFGRHPALGGALAEDPTRVWEPLEIANRFILPSQLAVGERTVYSNTNMLLLGMIADSVTGSTIATEFRYRFWEPLQLENVFLASAEEPQGDLASAWVNRGEGELVNVGPFGMPVARSFGWGAFGLKASVGDMARWGEALMGGTLFGEELVREMFTAAPPPNGTNVAIGTGVGLGLRRYEIAGFEVWGHSGVAPDATSLLIRDQSTGVIVVTGINQSPRTSRNSHFRIAAALLKIANGSQ
jgi:D-alanyl-D-alanine carboxypeptidase